MCLRYFLKILNFFLTIFLTIFCCLLMMAFVIGFVGCIMMGLYSIGSLLLTGHINSILAFYVSLDTAFILGGGLALIVAFLSYSNIYNYFDRCIYCYGDNEYESLNLIPKDKAQHSTISIKANHLLKDNKEFECPICLDSMLLPPDEHSENLQPVTLRQIHEEKQNNAEQGDRSHDEASYHKGCIVDWIDRNVGVGEMRAPVSGITVNLFLPEEAKPELVWYNGYNKRQRDLWRETEEFQKINSGTVQSNRKLQP